MIQKLITLLVIALVLYVIYYVAGLFLSGVILQVIAIILGLVFLWRALELFGIKI